MEKDILQFERIRSYIQDRMSVEERTSFERDLLSDKNLSAEYEFLKGVSQAVVKINSEEELRALLAKAEEEHKANPAIVDEEKLQRELEKVERDLAMLDKAEEKVSILNKVKAWFAADSKNGSSAESAPVFRLPYSSRLAISLAVAAGLALAIIFPYSASLSKKAFNAAPSLIETQISRSSTSELINKAVSLYNSGEYKEADSVLDKAESLLDSSLTNKSTSDSGFFVEQELLQDFYKVKWYRALTYMKLKKVKTAKSTLKSISESDSPYANKADYYLNNVY